MQDSQLIDILLNRHVPEDVIVMIAQRAQERASQSQIVSALPPGIAQRTPEWYAARKGMLTASEFKIAGAPEVSQSYVMGKVFPAPFITNSAMEWGCRFEDLACATYELEHNTKVLEYGLLVHPDDAFIGASPDGITPYGVAIEIKCPFSRKREEIDKRIADARPFPKSDRANLQARYVPQMQGQLEVVGLEICDFVTAHIDAVDEATFWQLRRVSDHQHRYAIVVDMFKGVDDTALAYRTCPLDLSDDALSAWLTGVSTGARVSQVWYVHMRELGVKRIGRDREHWKRIREGLGRTKADIDAVMAGAAPSDGCVGNTPLFSDDPE